MESRKPGEEWGLRSRCTELNSDFRNGRKTLIEVINAAATVMDGWSRIHTDNEFKITVIRDGQEHPYKRKDTKWRKPTADDLASIAPSRATNYSGRLRSAERVDERADADESSGKGADDSGEVDLSGHEAFASSSPRRRPQGSIARGAGLY